MPADVQIGLVDGEGVKGARITKRDNWRTFISSRRLAIRGAAMRTLQGTQVLPFFERVQFWLNLRRLQKDRSQVQERYGAEYETYREKGADDEQIRQLNHQEQYELGVINEKIYQLYSQRIIAQAERFFVPAPDLQNDREQWEVARITRRWRLRRQALKELLSAIHEAEKKRRDAVQAS